MEMSVKTFGELSKDELYDILRLRCAVFIVEQNCPYQDIDGADSDAFHLCAYDGGRLIGYVRIIFGSDSVTVGRVISVRRREGIATGMMKRSLEFIREKAGPCAVKLEAQVYAEPLYSKLGFVRMGEPFLLDGIPHVAMELLL